MDITIDLKLKVTKGQKMITHPKRRCGRKSRYQTEVEDKGVQVKGILKMLQCHFTLRFSKAYHQGFEMS